MKATLMDIFYDENLVISSANKDITKLAGNKNLLEWQIDDKTTNLNKKLNSVFVSWTTL